MNRKELVLSGQDLDFHDLQPITFSCLPSGNATERPVPNLNSNLPQPPITFAVN